MIPVKIYEIRGSLNLSVNKTYSVVALRNCFFLYKLMCYCITEFVIKKKLLVLGISGVPVSIKS